MPVSLPWSRQPRTYSSRASFWTRYKLGARLKVIAVLAIVVMFVQPLRNTLVPGWPRVWNELTTLKVVRINVFDFFFFIDRTPYSGSCQDVREKLAKFKMPKLEDMHVYEVKDYDAAMKEKEMEGLSFPESQNYKPSLSVKEQRFMLYALLSVTQAFNIFNITYFISEGTLIGYWRHHGMIPWDDDADMLFDSDQWQLAKKVISCLPDLQLDIGSDFMWKVYHKDADLWVGNDKVRFPFVDVFPYRNDQDHTWPLCIWFKQMTIAKTKWIFPLVKGVFEGWSVNIPNRPDQLLSHLYGKVSSECVSRTFMRRERYLVPKSDRTNVPCSKLNGVFPFVRRSKVDMKTKTVLEERMIYPDRVLSTFNTSYRGTLDD